MKQLRNIVLIIITLLSTKAAYAGRDGGGGGGFLVNGKYITFAESGLDLVGPKSDFDITSEMANAIDGLTTNIHPTPFRDYYRRMAYGEKANFKLARVVDSKIFENIKSDYMAAVVSVSHKHFRNFLLYAVSDERTTYILPEFFNLNLKQQAQVIVHEGLIRSNYQKNSDYGMAFTASEKDELRITRAKDLIKIFEIDRTLLSLQSANTINKREMSALLALLTKQVIRDTGSFDNLTSAATEVYPLEIFANVGWEFKVEVDNETPLIPASIFLTPSQIEHIERRLESYIYCNTKHKYDARDRECSFNVERETYLRQNEIYRRIVDSLDVTSLEIKIGYFWGKEFAASKQYKNLLSSDTICRGKSDGVYFARQMVIACDNQHISKKLNIKDRGIEFTPQIFIKYPRKS